MLPVKVLSRPYKDLSQPLHPHCDRVADWALIYIKGDWSEGRVCADCW